MQVLNFNSLLQPISIENPTGIDLRLDAVTSAIYYQLKDARQEARSAEKHFMMQESDNNGLSHWQQVYDLAIEVLTNQSKDLEILAWFIEASLRVYHYEGLANGFKIATAMIDQHWESIFPIAEEGDLEIKLASFIGLNGDGTPGTLIQPLKSIAITEGKVFVLWQYQQAQEVEKLKDKSKRDHRIRELGFNLSDIHCAVKETSPGFYNKLIKDLNHALNHYLELDKCFTAKCGTLAPPTSYIKNTLQEVLEQVNYLLIDMPLVKEVFLIEDKTLSCNDSFTPSNPLGSRAEALDLLSKVANYFSDTEPHSPIPFLLQRAIRWGGMSLPELMLEMVTDSEARNNITKLTGIILIN